MRFISQKYLTGTRNRFTRWSFYKLSILGLLCLVYFGKYIRYPFHMPSKLTVVEDQRPKQVVLHTYMRGGSTLLGTMFDFNEEAFYWFEPIQSVYRAAFALKDYINPIQLYTRNASHSRKLTELETKTLTTYLRHLLDCEFGKIPMEFFSFGFTKRSKVGKPYVVCMNSTGSFVDGESIIRPCKEHLPLECSPKNVSLILENNCHQFMNLAHQAKNLGNVLYRTRNVTKEVTKGILQPINTIKLLKYIQCMETWRTKHQYCLLDLQRVCQKSNLRVTKVIRSNANLTAAVAHNENSYIIYLLRDPRGILASRKDSNMLSEDIHHEAKLLCEKMYQDMNIFKKLNNTGQAKILFVKYESLATNPYLGMKQVFDFLKSNIPAQLKEFFNNLNKNITEEKVFSIHRKNSTKTAFAWRTNILPNLKHLIDEVCQHFLYEAGYPL